MKVTAIFFFFEGGVSLVQLLYSSLENKQIKKNISDLKLFY